MECSNTISQVSCYNNCRKVWHSLDAYAEGR